MGLLDDVTGFLDDVRQLGDELTELKDDVVSSVADFAHEASGTVAELTDFVSGESAEE